MRLPASSLLGVLLCEEHSEEAVQCLCEALHNTPPRPDRAWGELLAELEPVGGFESEEERPIWGWYR